MPNTQKVADGIFLIDAMMWFPDMASAYLVAGKSVALVETGLSTSAPHILEGMKELGFRREDISYVIVTHAHLDHAGSAGILMREFPRARLISHKLGAPHVIDPSRLMNGAKRSLGEKIANDYRLDLVVPVDAGRIDTVEGGEIMDLGGRSLEIIHTPGHAPYHISPYEREHRALFTGDLLGGYDLKYDDLCPFTPAPEFNLEVTLESINKLKLMEIEMLLFSHFGPSRQVERLLNMAIQKHTRWGEICEKAWRERGSLEYVSHELLGQIRNDGAYMPDWLNVESATMCAQGFLNDLKRKSLN